MALRLEVPRGVTNDIEFSISMCYIEVNDNPFETQWRKIKHGD